MSVSIQRILFATDFSGPARNAQQYAQALADTFGAQLHALHVVSEAVFVPSPEIEAQWLHDEEERARKQLAAEVAALPATIMEVRTGTAEHEIVKYASEQNIDVIVIATHGRTGLSRMLLGSVAEKVVRLATCPVLTVHPRDHQFAMDAPGTSQES